jgi:hypothetical protein
MDHAVFVLPNANAGVTTITVHFSAPVSYFLYDVSEWRNIAITSPLSGAIGADGVPASPSASEDVSAGSFTPANNDANGGNLILYWIFQTQDPATSITSIAASGGFTLLDADLMWQNLGPGAHASAWYLQPTAAAINPTMHVNANAGNAFNALAISLKAASAGRPPAAGIRIVKINHFSNQAPRSSTLVTQFPCSGNLIVVTTANCDPQLTGVSDSNGNTYAHYQAVAGGSSHFWVAQNARCSLDLHMTMNITSYTGGSSWRVFEITGARTTNAVDASAGTEQVPCSGFTSIAHMPDITPPTANGLTIAAMGLGLGPGLAATSPANTIWDLVNYPGQTDGSFMDNSDCTAHLYNTDTSLENWTWSITSQSSNSCFAQAIHIAAQ